MLLLENDAVNHLVSGDSYSLTCTSSCSGIWLLVEAKDSAKAEEFVQDNLTDATEGPPDYKKLGPKTYKGIAYYVQSFDLDVEIETIYSAVINGYYVRTWQEQDMRRFIDYTYANS